MTANCNLAALVLLLLLLLLLLQGLSSLLAGGGLFAEGAFSSCVEILLFLHADGQESLSTAVTSKPLD